MKRRLNTLHIKAGQHTEAYNAPQCLHKTPSDALHYAK